VAVDRRIAGVIETLVGDLARCADARKALQAAIADPEADEMGPAAAVERADDGIVEATEVAIEELMGGA
jgi:hypothetical protein